MSTQNAIATVEMPGTPQTRQAITPMQMLQIAVEQGADLDKLSKLMDLQERWEANEARKAYVAAISAFKADPPRLHKNKTVRFGDTEYDHATLDNVCDVIVPALSKQGLSHRWEVEQLDGGMIRVTCVLTHILGHSERVSMQSGADQSGKKNNIQAIASASTYLQRYTLLAATGMAAGDMDDDAGQVEYVTGKQAMDLETLCEDVGANKAAFLKYMKFESFERIPAVLHAECVAALEKKRGTK